jgi:hypothetical protein
MPKIAMLSLCAFLLTAGAALAAPGFPAVGAKYQVVFTTAYLDSHSMDSDIQYVLRVDAVSSDNPNWILIDFPPNANSSYNSNMGGKRWINLNFVIELQRL